MAIKYSVQCRVPGKTPWTTEDGATGLSEAEAVKTLADLALREPTNDEGDTLEYRVLETAAGE
jgi:hypothetical protein